MGLTSDSAQRKLSANSTVVCNRRPFLVGMVFILLCESAIHAEQRVLPPKDLLAGATWEYSINDGETFSAAPPTVSPGKSATIVARIPFTVKTPPACTNLELSRLNFRRSDPVYKLNGTKLKGPLEGMRYRTIPAIEPSLLRGGQNTLTARLEVANKKPGRGRGQDVTVRLQPALLALTAKHLKFDIEPVLGAFGPGFFTITARTNTPAKVTVYSVDLHPEKKLRKIADSPKGLLHRIRVQVGATDMPSHCLVIAENSEHREIASITVPPTGKTDRK